ncbi:MAG: hypothetical protein AABX33_02155 [Nanoarchaeota archaeon]
MPKSDKCSNCDSIKQTEIITGGMTLTVYRGWDYTVREEMVYEKNDKYSKWICTDCGVEWV